MISYRLLACIAIVVVLNANSINVIAASRESGTESVVKIQELTAAIAKQPHSADAYLKRGLFYETAEDEDKALSDFNKAIELEPANAKTYLCRADQYLKMELFAKAAKDYITSANLSKIPADKTNALRQAGRSQVKAGQPAEGLKLLDQALTLAAPLQKPNVYLNRAEAHLGLKQCEAAVADINSMGVWAEHWESARSFRATALMALGRYEAAVPDLTEAIKLAATKPNTLEGVVFQHKIDTYLRQRAVCFDKLGKKDFATLDRRKADAAQEDSLMFAPFR